jgi:hypothetical protein
MEMGFSEADSKKALLDHKMDESAAVEALLSGL